MDSSALVKLVVDERESSALANFLASRTARASCVLAQVEVIRAVSPWGSEAVARAKELLENMYLIALDDDLLNAAGRLGPPTLRSLDAIHLAAALTLRSRLSAIVTYDQRMARAASALGLTVAAPGRGDELIHA